MAPLDNLIVTTSEDDPNAITAEGQIDSHTSRLLDDALTGCATSREVAVDLSLVSFIDSSGLRVLVQAHKRQSEGGGGLTIVAPSDAVRRLFDITGLTSELSIRS